MNLRLLHRRLAVLMGLAALAAFAGGAGLEAFSAVLAAVALLVALAWHPGPRLSAALERVWLPLAVLLVARALLHVFVIRGDVVIPVVDLLLLLMAAEALRSLDAANDIRLYALSFALLLASTAYRPGVLFLVAFVGYVGVAALALMVGHLRRQAERHRVGHIPLGRALLGTTFGLTGVILVVAAIVFVTFPRVTRGWAGRGETPATSIVGFSDQISIGEHGSRIYGNPQIVLRVEFPGGRPAGVEGLRWRGRSYDRFDGIRWSRSRTLPPSGGPSSWYRERWTAPVLEQRIFAAPLSVRVLFGLHPVLDIQASSDIQPLSQNSGDFGYWGSGAPAYTVWSRMRSPSPEELRVVGDRYRPSRDHFLQLPRLDDRVRALADSLTAGLPTRYDKVVAVERHLRSFAYTLELPATAREATLEHFLLERRAGHCEYFSTAMVVLLRAVGIEARNVNGFLGGEWNDFGNYLVVSQNQAHSWVEVWFSEYGWVTFDPTPGGAGAAERRPAWFWPGRILFDGIQHRWGKWVLDYSLESQAGILGRWADAVSGPQAERAAGRATGAPWARPLGILAVVLVGFAVLAGAAALAGALGGRGRVPPVVRAYLRLRASCERAGVPVPPGLTPLALVARIGRTRASAAGAAERVVDLYLRVRFGGHEALASEVREMEASLKEARRALKEGAREGVAT